MSVEPQPVRALIDTNVALDWILDRKPWSDQARPLWAARDAGRIVAYLPASVLTDIFYIVRRQADIATAFNAVDSIFSAVGLFAVDAALLQQARALPGADFEDNVQIACAINAQLDLIVIRNPTDFRHQISGADTPAFSAGGGSAVSLPFLAACARIVLYEQNTHPHHLHQIGR